MHGLTGSMPQAERDMLIDCMQQLQQAAAKGGPEQERASGAEGVSSSSRLQQCLRSWHQASAGLPAAANGGHTLADEQQHWPDAHSNGSQQPTDGLQTPPLRSSNGWHGEAIQRQLASNGWHSRPGSTAAEDHSNDEDDGPMPPGLQQSSQQPASAASHALSSGSYAASAIEPAVPSMHAPRQRSSQLWAG